MDVVLAFIAGGLFSWWLYRKTGRHYFKGWALALALWFVAVGITLAHGAEVRFASGGHINVSERAAPPFQQLVNWLEARGYQINAGASRGYGAGTVRHSKHPQGLAMDLNQLRRNVVSRRFPPGTTVYAASLGILHGAVWHYGDYGHFEIMTPGVTHASHQKLSPFIRAVEIAHGNAKQEQFTQEK